MGVSLALGQEKRPLTHADYAAWESASRVQLSVKGTWASMEVNPQKGDGYLQLSTPEGTDAQRVVRANRASFTYPEDYLVFAIVPEYDTVRALKLAETKKDDMPKDSMGIITLKDGSQERIPMVASFSVPDKGGNWLAYLYEEGYPEPEVDEADSTAEEEPEIPGQILVIRNLESGEEYAINRVKKYAWAESGSRLALTRVASADSVDDAGVFVFNISSGEFSPVDTGQVSYSTLSWDKPGDQLAFMASPDSSEADLRHFTVHLWDAKGGLMSAVSTGTTGIPEGWWVSEDGSLDFSENGERLFLSTRPMPIKYTYEEDTTLLDEDKPGIDIWHWQDKRLQPEQLLDQREDQSRDYEGVYWIASGKYVQLADEQLPYVSVGNMGNANIGVSSDRNPFQRSYSWSMPWRVDIYSVDLSTGARNRIANAAGEGARVSPEGNFFYWYEASDSNWMVYDVAEQVTRNVSENIPYPMWDEEDDHPMLPYEYGSAGWLSKDEALLVYDKFDIWQVDPKGESAPVRLTEGRSKDMRYRMYRVYWNEEGSIPKKELQMISGTNTETMASGIFHLDIRKQTVKELAYGDRLYSGVRKAEEAKVILFNQMTYRESANVYGADWDLKRVVPLTSLNPQQEEIAWGNVELVNYRSLSGEPLKGLLYKPEDFDPTKKYPMIVYFYEKSSQGLHFYRTARPSSSTINFPWAVSNGYLVFVPDIIYKEGLPGPSAYDCIVPGTLAMIDRGYVDETKIGLQGQSWGGYQTAYLVTRTNLYACASAGAVVSNMTSAYGGIRWGSGLSRMFQYERSQSRIGGTLWERRDMYIENSPVFFADRIETPVLLMHNDEDTAVPWYQGIEMFVAMRRLDKPVWMLNYNGEPHNLRQWRNRMDLSMRMGQFFNHYLMDEPMPLWMEEGIPAKDKGRYLGYELEKEDEVLIEDK